MMTGLSQRVHYLLLLALIAWLSPPIVRADTRQVLQQALATGKPTVLVISPPASATDRGSESYADWAEYLNNFSKAHRSEFQFVKAASGELKTLFVTNTSIKERFAVVFFKNDHDARYYDGMILEPFVYGFAASYLLGKQRSDDPAAESLEPFKFVLRR
jgi:hypothetical protein